MSNRHLLEGDEHLRALREFNDLELIGNLVDWGSFRSLLEKVWGPPRTAGVWSLVVGLSPDLLQYSVGGDEEPE